MSPSGSADREASCPSCGAPVPFDVPGVLTSVCTFCDGAVYRTDRGVELLGIMSERTVLASRFQLGTRGRWRGDSFVVRGQLQLDHGRGLWNEWAAQTDDGEWIWFAEAQGHVYALEEVDAAEASIVDLDKVRVGNTAVTIECRGSSEPWMAVEVGAGEVVTAAGQLPIEVRVGEETQYTDVALGEHGFGSVDWTRGGPELLLGLEVKDALELDETSQPDHRPERVKTERLACPTCGGDLDLHEPALARTVGCPHCGSVLAHDLGRLEVAVASEKARRRPAITLGTEGTLRGVSVRVLGYLERRVSGFTWREYLLRRDGGGFLWLVEAAGHWSLATPISPASCVRRRGTARRRGVEMKHYATAEAKIHYVLGEFFYDVRVKDAAKVIDYVHPPTGLSFEETPTELVASQTEHLEPDEVQRAFRVPKMPRAEGVGMLQPNRVESVGTWWAMGAASCGILIAAALAFLAMHDNERVLEGTFGPTPAVESEDTVSFTEPFDLPEKGNLKVRLDAPGLNNGWLGVSGALVEVETGDVTSFVLEASRWSGVSGGESWTEGSRDDTTYVGPVPAGRYEMRLAALGHQAGLSREYSIRVHRDTPRFLWFGLALLAVLSVPVVMTVLWFTFEASRWKDSDHPWLESSS